MVDSTGLVTLHTTVLTRTILYAITTAMCILCKERLRVFCRPRCQYRLSAIVRIYSLDCWLVDMYSILMTYEDRNVLVFGLQQKWHQK